jgi:hypothetical protein
MSYAALDISEQDAQPVLLFAFLQGSYAWYYCTGSTDVTYGGHTYTHVPLLPGSIAKTSDVPKDTLEIKLPITNAFAAAFLAYTPDAVTTVTVRRLHYGDVDAQAIIAWKGRVLAHVASLGTLTLICEPVFSTLRRLGLRQTYQRLCRHVLGGLGCNVNRALYSSTQTVVALSGVDVTFAAPLPADYTGGTILAVDGTQRMIVAVGTSSVQLMRPVKSLADSLLAHPAGFTVTLYQGCDRSTAMCESRFGNIGCFGGFPGIPWINPMTNTTSVFT